MPPAMQTAFTRYESFVVGAGGKDFMPAQLGSPVWRYFEDNTWGVLKLSLKADGYDWEFVPEAGKTFTDKGSESAINRLI